MLEKRNARYRGTKESDLYRLSLAEEAQGIKQAIDALEALKATIACFRNEAFSGTNGENNENTHERMVRIRPETEEIPMVAGSGDRRIEQIDIQYKGEGNWTTLSDEQGSVTGGRLVMRMPHGLDGWLSFTQTETNASAATFGEGIDAMHEKANALVARLSRLERWRDVNEPSDQ